MLHRSCRESRLAKISCNRPMPPVAPGACQGIGPTTGEWLSGSHLDSVLHALTTGSAGGVVHGVLVSSRDVLLDVMASLQAARESVETPTREDWHLTI